jgi:hypothetical protein
MAEKAVSSIRKFWRRLTDSVHPDDVPTFSGQSAHTFNLKYPPPVFVGNIDIAPIIVLMSNGGYAPGVTEAEFPDEAAKSAHRAYIRGETDALPPTLSGYYVNGPFSDWIAKGNVALVNAIPYRSPRLSSEPHNQRVAKHLPSLAVHRRWITEEVLPQAKLSKRFLFVHRNRWWNIPKEDAGPCVVFSDPARAEPNRPAPDKEKLDLAQEWLRRRCE